MSHNDPIPLDWYDWLIGIVLGLLGMAVILYIWSVFA